MQVFNRWGSLVYRSEDYKNDWGGESNMGVQVMKGAIPDGTYYYVIDTSDGKREIRYFTISR
jgi:hypothetical protein